MSCQSGISNTRSWNFRHNMRYQWLQTSVIKLKIAKLWISYHFVCSESMLVFFHFIKSHRTRVLEIFILNSMLEICNTLWLYDNILFSFHYLLSDILQEGSVVRVLEVLSGPFVEARVKQSALTQLSVMTEDSRLHQVFIDQCGVEVFIKMLHKVVVSKICILKNNWNWSFSSSVTIPLLVYNHNST